MLGRLRRTSITAHYRVGGVWGLRNVGVLLYLPDDYLLFLPAPVVPVRDSPADQQGREQADDEDPDQGGAHDHDVPAASRSSSVYSSDPPDRVRVMMLLVPA